MKIKLTLFFALFLLLNVQAQEEGTPARKGKFIVETGYNIIAGITSGSGISILIDGDGESLTSLGADLGYFISDNFALKFRLSLLSGSGTTITNISGGGKYYIAGKIPVEAGVGILSGEGSSEFLGHLTLGYAAVLAPNIYLEPGAGLLFGEGDTLGNFKLSFVLLF